MRFRFGLATGFAVGYYLGARAGRERYEEINRTIDRIRGSDAFGTASEKARAAVDLGMERVRDAVETKSGAGNGYSSSR